MSAVTAQNLIGIHDSPGTFSARWIKYCAEKEIPFRRINCLGTDVLLQCEGLDALLWHWGHGDPANLLVARQIIASLEAKGIVVFPNVNTCWHYDDKIGQKYLLEAICAPLIPTWIFTSKADAEMWIGRATWPKVFKLRCGAGSANVQLVRTRAEAKALCRQAFAQGFPAVSGYLTDMRMRLRRTKTSEQFWNKLCRAPRMILRNLALRRQMPRQQGYMYFQEFLPGNTFDTRITIIGDRAFGFMRENRPNDFRASGSGLILYERGRIDNRCVEIGFRVADRLVTQSLAFDFIFNSQREPMIAEISYCYVSELVHACSGHWDHQGTWHEGHVWPQEAILDDILKACRQKTQKTK